MVNVDETYYKSRRGNWIESVLKHKGKNECKILYISNNNLNINNIDVLKIDSEKIKYSKHPTLKNRSNFVCLESGEFLDFYEFKDDDTIILCDWDVTMQREMNEYEISLIENLKHDSFGMNKDHYPQSYLNNYLNINTIFFDIDPSWLVYNTGIQCARVSSWKKLYFYWKIYYNQMFSKCNHHAAGQALFNYIIQKHNMLEELPPTFHNADWFHGTPARVINNKLYVNEELVLFNHHKFRYLPNF